jgi:hypothetical protein
MLLFTAIVLLVLGYMAVSRLAGPADHRVPRGNQDEKRATIRMRMAPGVGWRREGVAKPKSGYPGERVFPRGSTSCGGRSGLAQHLQLQKDQHLPGRHITDCQTRLCMKSRQT